MRRRFDGDPRSWSRWRSRSCWCSPSVHSRSSSSAALPTSRQRSADRQKPATSVATAQLKMKSDPDLANMLAIHAARVASPQGELPPEVMDALHAGVQATRTQYPVSTAPSALRAGAGGGVFLLPPDELIQLAQGQVARGFTDEECRGAGLTTCPDPRDPVASGLRIAGGGGETPVAEHPTAGRCASSAGCRKCGCDPCDAGQLRVVHEANRNRRRHHVLTSWFRELFEVPSTPTTPTSSTSRHPARSPRSRRAQ